MSLTIDLMYRNVMPDRPAACCSRARSCRATPG